MWNSQVLSTLFSIIHAQLIKKEVHYTVVFYLDFVGFVRGCVFFFVSFLFVCLSLCAVFLSLAFGILTYRIFQIYITPSEKEAFIKQEKEFLFPCNYNPHITVF